MKKISLLNFHLIRMIQILIFAFILERNSCEITIGGLFSDTAEDELSNIQQLTFKFAAQRAAKVLSENNDINFTVLTKQYHPDRNSMTAFENTCEFLNLGAAGIFGPQYGDSHHIVQAICDAKEIPNIQTRWDPQQRSSSCSVNLYPYPYALAEAFPDIVQKWKWDHYLILYENSESLVRINPLLEHEYNSSIVVKLQRIYQDEHLGYRPLLREIKQSEETNIILDCSIEILPEIFLQAQQIGLMGSDYSFLITNLDLQTLNLEPYQYGGTNITGIRLFDPQNGDIVDAVEGLNKYIQEEVAYRKLEPIRNESFSLELALIYDAVFLYAAAAAMMLNGDFRKKIPVCDSEDSWAHGYSLINSMKLSALPGLTGEIIFDNEGFRSEFMLEIIELTEDGITKVGKWRKLKEKKEIHIDRIPNVITNDTSLTLKNKTFTMAIVLNAPFAMLKKAWQTLSGNDQYEGFCVDLIAEISKMNDNFTVNLVLDPEKKTGTKDKDGNWTGMIGSIHQGKVHLACADITINRDREEVVDITSPFMDLGIAILYKSPQDQSPGFFSFLSPFDTEVWILVITAYVTVSLLFFIMGRISPYEWRNPFPCVQDPDELENQFTLSNSFWFTTGALMQQGSEIAPVSVSTRMAAGVWWFFTLIMVACYTANLAAFLTIETPTTDFTNIEELYNNKEVEYGLLKNGATETFFKNTTNPLYKKMYEYMKANAARVITDNSTQGVELAEKKDRKYAFLMESSQIEYETERHCTLTQVGKTIDSKGYGIAMRKGSWYLGLFSQSILKMQEEGTLTDLKRKWWKEKYTVPCAKKQPDEAETLGLPNLGGVFMVLGAGVLLAMFVAIFEQLFYSWSVSKEENISIKERLKSELKFFLQCRGTVKYIGGEDESSNINSDKID